LTVSQSPPKPRDNVVIRIRGLVNQIGGNLLHDHIDLDVMSGEVLALVGASRERKIDPVRRSSGSPADGGHRRGLRRERVGLERGGTAELRKRWGVLFQEGALFSSQTVTETSSSLRELMHLPRISWAGSRR